MANQDTELKRRISEAEAKFDSCIRMAESAERDGNWDSSGRFRQQAGSWASILAELRARLRITIHQQMPELSESAAVGEALLAHIKRNRGEIREVLGIGGPK